jgi:hypothetical protein
MIAGPVETETIDANFAFVWSCIVTNFLIIKPARCTNFSNLFWNETLHVSDNSSAHHQELFTVHSAMVYVIHVWRQLSSRIRMESQLHPDPAALLQGGHLPPSNKNDVHKHDMLPHLFNEVFYWLF